MEENLVDLEKTTSNLSIQCVILNESNDKHDCYYTKSKEYWEKIPASVNGMLGGFGNVTTTGN